MGGDKKSVSPDLTSKETAFSRRLLFLLLGNGLFGGGLFSFFSGHSFIFLGLTELRNFSFSRRLWHHAFRRDVCK
jgi:hypothetical protein